MRAQTRTLQKKSATALLSGTLTAQEGETILEAASVWEKEVEDKPDCSHLTHDVYGRAGYPYPYARSIDLYRGIQSFVRVKRPQPGDLVVWRGHVGIVVDPSEHSFYSSVRSGLRTEFYDLADWKARGPARFYRYAVVRPGNPELPENLRVNAPRNAPPYHTSPTLADFHANFPDGRRFTTKNSAFRDSAVESTSTRVKSDHRDGTSN